MTFMKVKGHIKVIPIVSMPYVFLTLLEPLIQIVVNPYLVYPNAMPQNLHVKRTHRLLTYLNQQTMSQSYRAH